MKILYNCFSCSPYYGSDEGIGWNWPFYMRKHHEVWVLVRNDRKHDIDKYCKEHEIDDIHFVYCDIPEWMNFYYKNLKKGKNGTLDFLLYQLMWQFPAYYTAKRLHKIEHFDLVHHVSTNDFRLIGRLHRLGIPYILGPIGGAQKTPVALKEYTLGHEKSEKLRLLLNFVMTMLPGYKKALNTAEKIYFSNKETFQYLESKIKNKEKCELMTEIAYAERNVKKINTLKHSEGKTIFLWSGRMEYRKGLALLFEALEYLPLNEKWKLILCGTGSESENYHKQIAESVYADYVYFTGQISYDEMQAMYNKADVFVFPSLRETTGTVIIEAMAHSLPVICLNQGGGALVVTAQTGFLVNGQSKIEYVKNFANAMIECIDNFQLVQEKGQEAQKRILKFYTWEDKIKKMNEIYNHINEKIS